MIANNSTSFASSSGAFVNENDIFSITSDKSSVQRNILASLLNEGNNPFENTRDKNYPPLEEFFRQDTDEHSESDGLHQTEVSVISHGGSSFISNANLSIGARASVNEHLRHIAKHGIDESVCSQHSIQHFEYGSRPLSETTQQRGTYKHQNPLDYLWEKLLDSSEFSDFPSNECSNEEVSNSQNMKNDQEVACGIVDIPDDNLLRRSKIVHSQSDDEEAIEVVNESSLSEYFDSSKVLLLRTPEKNKRDFERVTVRPGCGLEAHASNAGSSYSGSPDDGSFTPTISRIAKSTRLPKSGIFVERSTFHKPFFDIDISPEQGNYGDRPNTDHSFSILKTLDISRISADGSDAERHIPNLNTSFGNVENSFMQAMDEPLNNNVFPGYQSSYSFDSLSPVRNEVSSSLSIVNKTHNRREMEPLSHAAVVTPHGDNLSTPNTQLKNVREVNQYKNAKSESKYQILKNPPGSTNSNNPGSARHDSDSFHAEIDLNQKSPVDADGLSAITKQAAERASLFLRQLKSTQSSSERRYRSNKSSQFNSSPAFELRRTTATPFECNTTEKSAPSEDLDSLKAETRAHLDLHTSLNRSDKDEIGNGDVKTPETSFANDASNGLNMLDISPISNPAGLNDSCTHHLTSEVLWVPSSSSNSKDRSLEEKQKERQYLTNPADISIKSNFGLRSEISDSLTETRASFESLILQKKSFGSKFHPNSFSSRSAKMQCCFQNRNTSASDSFPVHGCHTNDEIETAYIHRTYPFINNSSVNENSWHSSPAAFPSNLTDRRRYRTVVPLRVFTRCTDDFYPTEYDSFAPAQNSSCQKMFKSRNLSNIDVQLKKGSMLDRSIKSNPV